MNRETANPNILWANLFVDSLAKLGLRAACLAAGSRSTPLTLAFASHSDIQAYSHIDERGAAFFALGHAQSTGIPTALVSTSGTAAANFYPAIVEANYSEAPLLVLTADRPPELRESGANQTIDQIKMFGEHVRWFIDAAMPQENPQAHVLRYVQTLAWRTWQRALGELPGPVHVNFSFRKPLEDTPADHQPLNGEATLGLGSLPSGLHPGIGFERGSLTPTASQIEEAEKAILSSRRGLILCGPRSPKGDFPQEVVRLSALTGYPVMADPLSGLRYGPADLPGSVLLGGYENYLGMDTLPLPEMVLQFGDLPISQALHNYLDHSAIRQRILFTPSGRWRDDTFRLTQVIWADPLLACQALNQNLQDTPVSIDTSWGSVFSDLEGRTWEHVQTLFENPDLEGRLLHDLIEILPEESLVYVGNSLPVRHLDQFAAPNSKRLGVYADRGTSGIDGTVSSALGVAAASGQRIFLVLGDLSLLHDMNALLLLSRTAIKVTIIVINNDGGGIFRRLPISAYGEVFEKYFLTPHGRQFKALAEMFDLDYIQAARPGDFKAAFSRSLKNDNNLLIEVLSDSLRSEELRQELKTSLKDKLAPKNQTENFPND